MLQTMLKKWWVILLQGILMIILSVFIFNNPAAVLAGISLWFGLIVLLVGMVGVIGWFAGSKEDREPGSLIWSIVTALFGLVMLTNIFATMKVVTIIFGIWMLVTGYNLFSSGWPRRRDGLVGWILVIIGAICVIGSFMMITNIGAGATGVSTILGIQVLLAGIALIILSFVKKAVVNRVEDKIENLKAKLGS